jgi:hypothetical protein
MVCVSPEARRSTRGCLPPLWSPGTSWVVTLGYTPGYLLIGSGPIRLCTCGVQVPLCRREAVVV